MIGLAIPRLATVAVLLVFSTVVLAVEARLDSTQQIQMADINSADPAAIAAALDGVGLTKAEEIVPTAKCLAAFIQWKSLQT